VNDVLVGIGTGFWNFLPNCQVKSVDAALAKFTYDCGPFYNFSDAVLLFNQEGALIGIPGEGTTNKAKNAVSIAGVIDTIVRDRMTLWESEAFHCNAVSPSFPSKSDHVPSANNPECDDGDASFYDGLLCASGDDRGCDAVRRSQKDGRWWRSPAKIATPEGRGGQTSLSNDLALGIIVYLAKMKDAAAYRRWIGWIHDNPRCASCVFPGALRYCQSDLCAFTAIDCGLLDRLGAFLGEQEPVCGPLSLLPGIPLTEDYKKEFESILDGLSLLTVGSLPIPSFRAQFDQLSGDYADAVQKAEDVYRKVGIEIPSPLVVTEIMANINARVDENPHLAAVELFFLKYQLRFGGQLLEDASEKLLARNRDNPFFIYVARGNSDPHMLEVIFNKCPAEKTDVRRYQWAWEREEANHAWTESMMWDCIFITRLWQTGPPSPIHDLGSVDDAWKNALGVIDQVKKKIEGQFDHMRSIIKDPKRCVTDLNQCMPFVGDCLETPSKCVPPSVEKCAKDAVSCVISTLPAPPFDYCAHNPCPF
jgi:hypothetical protein